MSFEWLGWRQPVTDPKPLSAERVVEIIREELEAYYHSEDNPPSESVTNAVRIALTGQDAQLAARDAEIARLREALEDCLHRLGNTWTLYGVPMNQWARLKQEVADGVGTDVDKPNGGGEYSWKLNWKAYVKARAALGGDS